MSRNWHALPKGFCWWTELMQMILPAARDIEGTTPRRRNSRMASRAQRNCPIRSLFQFAKVMSRKTASHCKPAL